jgi:hypothetical protein
MKLSFIRFAWLIRNGGGESVNDDHCLACRLVGIERGVRRNAFLRHGRPRLARRARYHWISEARQLTLAIFAPAIFANVEATFCRIGHA